MSFELNARQEFLKRITPFNKLKNEIRERLYFLRVSDTKELETLILLMFGLELFSLQFRSLRNPADFLVRLVRELLKSFNSTFPNEKKELNKSNLLKYLNQEAETL